MIDAGEIRPDRAADLIRTFVLEFNIAVLNVAGSRASEEPRAYSYALEVIGTVIS